MERMRMLMLILMVDALVCGMVVGRLPMENPEPVVQKAAGRDARASAEKSCYEWVPERE